MLTSIFISKLKNHYISEVYNHKQVFKIVSSMDVFGNLGQRITDLQNAVTTLTTQSWKGRDVFYNIGHGLWRVTAGVAGTVAGSASAIAGAAYHTSVDYLTCKFSYSYNPAAVSREQSAEKDVFEDDIESLTKELNQSNSPLVTIDTQNKIWLKIIVREQGSFEQRK